MPRRKKRPEMIGLRWRGERPYYEREHTRLEGGRLVKALRCAPELAVTYAHALNTLFDRGDFHIVERWRRDELHVADIARAVREGEYTKLKRLTAEGTLLGDAVDRFLTRTTGSLSERTARQYRTNTAQLIARFGRDFPMAQLDTEQAEAFLYEPKDTAGGQVWTAKSQVLVRTVCKALWRMVIEQEQEAAELAGAVPTVTRNPWKGVRVAKLRQTRHGFLTPEQWHTVITHEDVRGTRAAALLGFACLAGLRQQEITHLRPGIDVDFENAVVHIVDRKGEHEWKTKHPRSQRDVPMVPALVELVRDHIANGFATDRFLFHGYQYDRPITSKTAEEWTERCFTAAGIKYGRKGDALTLHSLRHTFATWMAQAGIPFHVIAQLMGNTAHVVITHYAHHAPNDLDRAIGVVREKSAVAPTVKSPIVVSQQFLPEGGITSSSTPAIEPEHTQQPQASSANALATTHRASSAHNIARKRRQKEQLPQQSVTKRPYRAPRLTRLTSPPAGVVFPTTNRSAQ